MKKLLSILALVGATMAVNAQEIGFTVKAGVNLANMTFSESGVNLSPKTNLGFNVSGLVDIPVSPAFTVQPGLTLQNKGFKFSASESGASAEVVTNIMSLDLPVNLLYAFPIESNALYLGAGPYVGYNLSGKAKTKATLNGNSVSESHDIKFGSGNDKDMKAIDYGVNFMAGFKISNGISINAGYGLGLANQETSSSTGTAKHNIWSFGLGYSL